MNPEINRLQDRLEALEAQALAIKAAAERDGRPLTRDELARAQDIFSEFDRVETELRLCLPQGRRQTQPGDIGGSMPGETTTSAQPGGERLIDGAGRELHVYGRGERLLDSIPRAERLAPGDLGGIVLGAATGDWSKVSDRCRTVMAQLGTAPDSAGGYLLPSPLSAEIIDMVRAKSVFGQTGHRTVVMTTKTLDYARIVSGITPIWRAEHQVIPELTPVLEPVTLTAKNLGALTRSSIELLEDAPVASTLLRDLLAEELAAAFDTAMFDGDGGLQPLGVLNQNGLQSIMWGTNSISYSPFMQALGLLWGISVEPNAVVVSPQTRIRLASLPTGISGDLQVLPMPAELAALTWLTTSKLGNQGGSPSASHALVGDFSTVVVGLRQQVRIETSSEGGEYSDPGSPSQTGDAFARNQVRIRATLRADLVLHQPSKIVRIVQIEG